MNTQQDIVSFDPARPSAEVGRAAVDPQAPDQIGRAHV